MSMMLFFFFNDTATTEIYTLSLHDALPISKTVARLDANLPVEEMRTMEQQVRQNVFEDRLDRKSTRLNSSHANISYAVFCLKKKNKDIIAPTHRRVRLRRCTIQHTVGANTN